MNGIRVSIGMPGATAAELIELAPLADRCNLAAIWIGDPRGRAENSADSYVTASAAAVAAVTEDIRLGLFLTLRREKQLVRIAEDVAVVDQASGGRVELGLVPSADERERWLGDAARFLRAWHDWELAGRNETVAVIPGPAQPDVPRAVVDDVAGADALGAGRIQLATGNTSHDLVPPRTILVVDPELGRGGVTGWLSAGAYDRVLELRERASAAGAQELLFLLPRGVASDDMKAMGTVLVPSLRATARDARWISTDSWAWLTEKTALHTPPPRD